MRWGLIALAAIAVVSAGLVGCAAIRLPEVPLDPNLGPSAPPPLLGAFGDDAPITTITQWEARRAPILHAAFEQDVYGPYPPNAAPARVLSRDDIAYAPLADVARIEQWSVAVGPTEAAPHFNMLVVLPRDAAGPVPLIVMENFCGNHAALPANGVAAPLTEVLWACDAPWAYPLIEAVFGRYINGPPYEDILARGYGLAMFYAGDVVADEPVGAREGLSRLYGDDASNAGAIAVYAWLYSQAYDVLAADPRVDAHRVAIWGHSRNGKAALYAASRDPRIAAVIAHQSGRGGASLSQSEEGESIGDMTEAFPWWFPSSFADAPRDPAMDQHQLLALIAPRPVLLGNGARDAWSDPYGAWQSARAATPAYELYGAQGLAQDDMSAPNLEAGLAYYTRPGLHGVTTRDWEVFLDFLDAHLMTR